MGGDNCLEERIPFEEENGGSLHRSNAVSYNVQIWLLSSREVKSQSQRFCDLFLKKYFLFLNNKKNYTKQVIWQLLIPRGLDSAYSKLLVWNVVFDFYIEKGNSFNDKNCSKRIKHGGLGGHQTKQKRLHHSPKTRKKIDYKWYKMQIKQRPKC